MKRISAAQKKAKVERQKKYVWVFMNGKQVRVKRPEMIDGMLVDDFIAANADDVWLTQNGMYDVLDARQKERDEEKDERENMEDCDGSNIPF